LLKAKKEHRSNYPFKFLFPKPYVSKDNNSSIEIPDGELFHYVLQKKYKLPLKEGAED
jgi:hypothetical protein